MSKSKNPSNKTRLGLQPHRHTGKLLHHRHTSYRALAVLLLLTGVILVRAEWSIRQIAAADSLFVSATVPAPIPTIAPVILVPTDGSLTHDPNITVSGTCQAMTPATTIAIYSNGILLGSAPCAPDGTFTVQVSLQPGDDQLIAKSVTITGDYGPDSAPVHITYTPLSPPISPPSSGGPGSNPSSGGGSSGSGSGCDGLNVGPLAIFINEPFIVFGPGKSATWIGTITGGVSPCKVTIHWGDKTTNTYDIGKQPLAFSHLYKAMMPHTIVFEVTDSAGNKAIATFSAVTPYLPPSASNILTGNPNNSGINPSILFAIYSGYISVLCIFGILWLRAHRSTYAKVRATVQRPVAAANRRRKR